MNNTIASDPITYSRDKIIKTDIPKEILELVFGGMTLSGLKKNIATEIDSVLMDVCDDLNLISGEVIEIDITRCKLITYTDGKIYYIPPELRRNRDVREVLSISSIDRDLSNSLGMNNGGTAISNALNLLNNSLADTVSTNIANVKLVDTNTFRIPVNSVTAAVYNKISVEIVNDSRLKQIKKGSYPTMYDLCLSYIKSYIYNKRIAISKGSLYGGHELTAIMNEVESYSGAREEYNLKKDEEGGKMLFFSDQTKLNALYGSAIK